MTDFMTPKNWLNSAVHIMILTDETAGHIHLLRVLRIDMETLFRTGTVGVMSEMVPGHGHVVTLLFAGGVISLGSIAGNHGHGLDLQIGAEGSSEIETPLTKKIMGSLVINGVSYADEVLSDTTVKSVYGLNKQLETQSIMSFYARMMRYGATGVGLEITQHVGVNLAKQAFGVGEHGSITVPYVPSMFISGKMAFWLNCKVASIVGTTTAIVPTPGWVGLTVYITPTGQSLSQVVKDVQYEYYRDF